MSISSINTNLAALLAQVNIGNASNQTNLNVAQLSSGNRIIQASNDVAALAAGTALQSQVNTLTTALSVASQGSSLLQVADGALAQIQTILQRQQAITTQAQSGSLSPTQLGFLNQEFQNLTQEIDQLSGSTNFNGVNLINGAIAGGSTLKSNTSDSTATAQTSAVFITLGANASNGDTVTIDGVKVTFTTAAAGTAAASGSVVVGNSFTSTAANLVSFLNSSGNPAFANLAFSQTTGNVSAVYSGGKLNGTLNITASAAFTSGSNSAAATTIAAGGANGLGLDSYSAVGTVTGSLLVTGDTTAQTAGAAIDVTGLNSNAAFIGSFPTIGTITGTFGNTADDATFTFKSGGITYSTAHTDLTQSATVVALTFTGKSDQTGLAKGGAFTVNLNGSAITASSITSQSLLDGITAQINTALSGVTVYQNRQINSFGDGATSSVSGVQTATLSGAQLYFHSNDFAKPVISTVSVSAPAPGSSDAKVSVVLNGQTYNSIAGIGNQIKTNTVITLQNASNPGQTIQLVTGNVAIAGSTNSTAIDLTSASNAAAFQATLTSALGISASNASLSFQVGSLTTDTIGVSIGNSSTSSLFGGASLDVLTQQDAAAAAGTLTSALNTVTSIRASVGALEERFNFASSAIQSAAQNEGAAKSTLLDTDVASTSTAFATAQVQLQAGIAVLAQANQLSQNLLKLIA